MALLIEELTRHQPFCAGLILFHQGRLVFTLAKEKRWQQLSGSVIALPIGCVGGGQEPGESILECAEREAKEEIGSKVQLQCASETLWIEHNRGTGISVADPIAPRLLHVLPGPDIPYKPGLPVGPWLYVAHYLAQTLVSPAPCDVPAVIEIPIGAGIRDLLQGLPLSDSDKTGLIMHTKEQLPAHGLLFVPPLSPERLILEMALQGSLWDGN